MERFVIQDRESLSLILKRLKDAAIEVADVLEPKDSGKYDYLRFDLSGEFETDTLPKQNWLLH